jgi:hypothetical protein
MSGTGGCRLEKNLGCILTPDDLVRDGSVQHGYSNHVLLGGLGTFRNRIGNFASLAEPVSDASFAVSDNNDGVERKPTTTLNHLGDSIHTHESLDEAVEVGAGAASSGFCLASLFH